MLAPGAAWVVVCWRQFGSCCWLLRCLLDVEAVERLGCTASTAQHVSATWVLAVGDITRRYVAGLVTVQLYNSQHQSQLGQGPHPMKPHWWRPAPSDSASKQCAVQQTKGLQGASCRTQPGTPPQQSHCTNTNRAVHPTGTRQHSGNLLNTPADAAGTANTDLLQPA